MILKVKIYERVFDVIYPSEKRVQDLMLEFVTQCKGAIKPGAKRQFFVCIHCGKADFSNKMRLNQHRFLIGCENAKFPDGVPALILPYPAFESGQGKKVEVMRKGVADQGAKKRKAKVDDSLHVDTSGTEDDKDAVDLGGFQPSKQSDSSVTAGSYIDSPQKIVPTPFDLLFGKAPTKVEKELSQGREHKFSTKGERTKDTLQVGPSGNNTQSSVVGRGFKKVFCKVQDPVLQVYKSRQGRTSGLEVGKGKTKTKAVYIQETLVVMCNFQFFFPWGPLLDWFGKNLIITASWYWRKETNITMIEFGTVIAWYGHVLCLERIFFLNSFGMHLFFNRRMYIEVHGLHMHLTTIFII